MSPTESPAEYGSGRRPRLAVVAAAIAIALFAAGCGMVPTNSPVPTPADFPSIVNKLFQRGITVRNWVSGDAGCSDRTLVPTSIAFDASGLDQPNVSRVHIYIFRTRDSFDRLRASVDDCARSYVTDPAGYENIAASPFVVAAQGPWGPKFKAAMGDALTAAAGNGG